MEESIAGVWATADTVHVLDWVSVSKPLGRQFPLSL